MTTFNDETRSRLRIPMVVSEDPDGSTIQVKILGAWHDAEWQGAPVPGTHEGEPCWRQVARTTEFFAGPAVADPGDAIVLPLGRHKTETAVTFTAGDRVASVSSVLNVTAS